GADLPAQQIGPVSVFTLLRQARLDLFDFEVDVGKPSNPHESTVRDFMMTATNEPARSFRQKKHTDAEDQRWSDGQTKHPSPAFNAGKSVIGQIRNDDADGDGELKERYNPAPRMRRCNFGKIDWHVCRGETNCRTENDAAGDQNRRRWRHCAGKRADAKDCCSHEEDSSPAETIGGFSTDDRANGRSQQNATDNDFLGCSREDKFAFDKNERAGD